MFSATFAAYPFPKTWQNTDYEKSIDVSKSFSKERHDINALNTNSNPNSQYIFALPRSVENDISFVLGIYDESTGGGRKVLRTKKLDIYDDDAVYYEVKLPYPIAPGSRFKFSVSVILTKQSIPYPEHIPMESNQVLKLSTNAYPLSPYDTLGYSLGILSAQEFNDVTEEDLPFELQKKETKSKEGVIYQAIEPIPANSISPFSFTFVKLSGLTYVNYIKRDLWLSHWSSALQMEEYYEVTNLGAKLDKGFSRAKYFTEKMFMKPNHAITALRIPFDATKKIEDDTFYFVDKVGNVSTSQYYDSELIVRPRFPIFGGWNYNFTIGWMYDLKQFVKQNTANDEYILSAHILDGIRDATYGNISFNIYLPEGAELIDYSLPFASDDAEISHEYSYLDIEDGHLKISFHFENLVDEMKNLELILRYKYSSYAMLHKPLQAAFYIFLALMGLYVLKKIDLSIKPTKNGKLIDSKNTDVSDEIEVVNK